MDEKQFENKTKTEEICEGKSSFAALYTGGGGLYFYFSIF